MDQGLIRYLEKKRFRFAREEKEKDELESMLKNWARIEEKSKAKRYDINNTNDMNNNDTMNSFTTPIPGSIIIDTIPQSEIVVYEAPMKRDKNQTYENRFEQPLLDKRRKKIYRGEEAMKNLGWTRNESLLVECSQQQKNERQRLRMKRRKKGRKEQHLNDYSFALD